MPSQRESWVFFLVLLVESIEAFLHCFEKLPNFSCGHLWLGSSFQNVLLCHRTRFVPDQVYNILISKDVHFTTQ